MKILIIISALFCITFTDSINDEKNIKNDNLIFNPDLLFQQVPKGINLKNLLDHLEKYVDSKIDISSVFSNLLHFPNSIALINEIKTEWESFKTKYNKVYADVKQESQRFLNFLRNYIHIRTHNIKYMAGSTSFNMAINHLSDLSSTEYSSLLGLKLAKRTKGRDYLSPLSKIDLPISVDYRNTAVTPVKDQGNCGSCWAFSTTGSLEGQHYRKTKKLVSLSEQQLVDCNMENNGCNGGIMDQAFEYIHKNNGIDKESTYPYVSGKTGKRQDKCKWNKKNVGALDTGFVDIKSGDEEQLKEAVALIGPISVGIDASNPSFMSYFSGVYDEPDCSTDSLDHGVLVVGYGVDEHSKIPYWLVKNSWNTTWGDKGFIKMKRNAKNMCGIATAASYPLV